MIELREHNVKPYHDLCAMLEDHDKVAYVSATGTGKTYVGGKYIEEHDLLDKTLILVPSDVIRKSWEKTLPGAHILSYQGMLRKKPDMEQYRLLICDEMHHLGAELWGEHYQEMIADYSGKIVGMSATPVRFLDNGRDMIEELFEGNRVTGIELPAAIEKGILPTMDYHVSFFSVPRSRLKSKKYDARTEKLTARLDVLESRNSVKNTLLENMPIGSDYKVSVFVNRVSELPNIKKCIEEIYPKAGHYIAHSKMKQHRVKEVFEAFKNHKGMAFIYTVDLLNEGAHVDGVNAAIMFRKTLSPNIYLQQLGRALNYDMAGERVLVFDFVANKNNFRTSLSAGNDVIEYIKKGISNPERQIIIHDETVETVQLINELESILSGVWTEEELQVIKELYDGGDGVPEILHRLPHRSEIAVRQKAAELGMTKFRSKKMQALVDDIYRYYCMEDGINTILRLHPDRTARNITGLANSLGIKRKEKGIQWTDDEDAVILANRDLKASEVAAMLPGRDAASVRAERKKLCITKERYPWSEKDFQILRDHADMPVPELRDKFFPDLTVHAIYRMYRNKGIKKIAPMPAWTDEKVDRFCSLYVSGGAKAVMEEPMFSDLKVNTIYRRAYAYKLKCQKGGRR